MNLFYLDQDIKKCAEYHIDKHVVKMILESAQLLCTTLWVDRAVGYKPEKLTKDELAEVKYFQQVEQVAPYKPISINHPCAIWTRSSYDNYVWVISYATALFEEYRFRYGMFKTHKSFEAIAALKKPNSIPSIGLTRHALAMPDQYKTNCVIQSYRNYYIEEKTKLSGWKNRPIPEWV